MSQHLPCYICKSVDVIKIHSRCRDSEKISVLKCTGCGLVYLDQMDHTRGEFYEESGMFEFSKPDPSLLESEEKEDTQRRVKMLSDIVHGRSYLDVGCGSGAVAVELKKTARTVDVVEPNRTLQEYLRSNFGFKAFGSIDEVDQKFDVISLFHVLEHIHDPADFLKTLSQKLNPGGQIIVEVPSATDALIKHYNLEAFKNFTYWSCHLYLFDQTTLPKVGQMAGLSAQAIRQVQRYPLANHVYWLREGKPGGHKKWAFLRSEELDRAYEKMLASQEMCDTLVAIFSKD